MDPKVAALIEYFSTNGTLADCVAITQLVASESWGEIAKLFKVIQGVI